MSNFLRYSVTSVYGQIRLPSYALAKVLPDIMHDVTPHYIPITRHLSHVRGVSLHSELWRLHTRGQSSVCAGVMRFILFRRIILR